MKSSQTVQEIGEQGLLQRLLPFCDQGVGDDGAVLEVAPGRSLVVTTDVLVDGVHFSDRTTTPEDVGWRAAAANLSDLAAMGASPVGITVGLSIRGDTPVHWVEGLYRGLRDCLQPYSTPIVGGDICRSSVVTIAITAFGQVSPPQIIRRAAARPGEAIVVTGPHGASRAGLELLLHPQDLDASERQYLIGAHRRPQPRLDVLDLLRPVQDAPVAGMDSSDGLADAVVQICRCSSVGAIIEAQAIPIPPALNGLVEPEQALEWALYGGEDFELVLCLPQQAAHTLVERLGVGAAIVGKITDGQNVELIDRRGLSKRLSLAKGFQHF